MNDEARDRRSAGLPEEVELELPEPVEVELVGDGPTRAVEELDRSDRLGRTSLQVGTPAAVVGIGSWLARLHGLDLDPGAGVDLPADVAGYFVAVFAGLMAWAMNRRPKNSN